MLRQPYSSFGTMNFFQVKIWFQNRRMKWRNTKERELMNKVVQLSSTTTDVDSSSKQQQRKTSEQQNNDCKSEQSD